MKEPYNPLVFPQDMPVGENGWQRVGGMTLRDYFAAQVMTGLVEGSWPNDWNNYAKRAYGIADAMLKARSTSE